MDANHPEIPDGDGSKPGEAETVTKPVSPLPQAGQLLRHAQNPAWLRNLAFSLIIVATSLYLLERLEPVLRPFLIASLLCYLFLPVYKSIRRYTRPLFAFLTIAVVITVSVQGLARMVYNDVVRIDQRMPQYQRRIAELEGYFRDWSKSVLSRLQPARDPVYSVEPAEPSSGESQPDVAPHPSPERDLLSSELSQRIVRGAANSFLSVFLESIVIAFYMIFLLQSASRLPSRIRASFSSERSQRILEITESINRAISEYLVVKVKASLLVGIPIGLACWAFGVTGGATWGVITFFGNFLPYVGALVAIVPPVALGFLEFDSIWPPIAFTLVVLSIHGVTANLIEPAMTGRALGLSPLVVLIGLAFWSLLWGFVGMVLAVPLTVIFKIILEHTPATVPLARMLSDEE